MTWCNQCNPCKGHLTPEEAAAIEAWTAKAVKLAEEAGFSGRSRQVAEVARAIALQELGELGTWVRDGKDYDFRNDAKDSIARAIENRVRFIAVGMLSYGKGSIVA